MSELAVDGIRVTVTCRVLKLSRQPYYRWLAAPVTGSEIAEAYRANALFHAHGDDPEFGHRLLADEARDAGETMSDRTAWRIGATNGWWSSFGKKRGKNGKKPGPPVHDDLCTVTDEKDRIRHEFTADTANQLWLTDITEHKTGEGKLYVCAIKDVFSNRIVGYSIDSRMKSRLAVNALENAVARRGDVAGCVVHSDRGSQFRSRKFLRALTRHRMVGRLDGQSRVLRRQSRDGIILRSAPEERPRPPVLGHPKTIADRGRDLDRADLSSTPSAGSTRTFDAHRVRSHHEHASRPGCVTETVTYPCSRPHKYLRLIITGHEPAPEDSVRRQVARSVAARHLKL